MQICDCKVYATGQARTAHAAPHIAHQSQEMESLATWPLAQFSVLQQSLPCNEVRYRLKSLHAHAHVRGRRCGTLGTLQCSAMPGYYARLATTTATLALKPKRNHQQVKVSSALFFNYDKWPGRVPDEYCVR